MRGVLPSYRENKTVEADADADPHCRTDGSLVWAPAARQKLLRDFFTARFLAARAFFFFFTEGFS